jgi:hypothetical protein
MLIKYPVTYRIHSQNIGEAAGPMVCVHGTYHRNFRTIAILRTHSCNVLPFCIIALTYGLIDVYGMKYIYGQRCKPCHRKDIEACIQSQGERERAT